MPISRLFSSDDHLVHPFEVVGDTDQVPFSFDLLQSPVPKVYTDGHYAYDVIFGDKATMKKSKVTNVIKNLNSQIRDKVSYLLRRSKAHTKNFEWLDNRLARFFVNKNLGL